MLEMYNMLEDASTQILSIISGDALGEIITERDTVAARNLFHIAVKLRDALTEVLKTSPLSAGNFACKYCFYGAKSGCVAKNCASAAIPKALRAYVLGGPSLIKRGIQHHSEALKRSVEMLVSSLDEGDSINHMAYVNMAFGDRGGSSVFVTTVKGECVVFDEKSPVEVMLSMQRWAMDKIYHRELDSYVR